MKKFEKAGLVGIAAASMLIAGLGISFSDTPANATETTASVPSKDLSQQTYVLEEIDTAILLDLLQISDDTELQIELISERYNPAWVAPTMEIFHFVRSKRVRDHLLKELRQTTGQDFGREMNDWFRWMWNQPELQVKGYDNFKAEFYRSRYIRPYPPR